MGRRNPRDNRPRHRCPKCRSANIYKRSLVLKWGNSSKKKGKCAIDDTEKDSDIKKYRCINCKNEFDTALIE